LGAATPDHASPNPGVLEVGDRGGRQLDPTDVRDRLNRRPFHLFGCGREQTANDGAPADQPVDLAKGVERRARRAAQRDRVGVHQRAVHLVQEREPLSLFLTNAVVPIHDNQSERALRVVALLPNNSLFVGSDEGGTRTG
jgi:hypothetical protein